MSRATTKETTGRGKYDSRHRGIYAIETNWYQYECGQEDATSIRPILQLLRDGWWKSPHISRDAATVGELFHYIDKWVKLNKQKSGKFPILYLGFHGSEEGKIWLETESGLVNMVNYEVLEEHLCDSCANSVIHFAGCSVMQQMKGKPLNQFLKSTNAVAVSGFGIDVGDDAYALEYLYLQYLQYFGRDNLTSSVVKAVKADLFGTYKELCKHFDFQLHVAY